MRCWPPICYYYISNNCGQCWGALHYLLSWSRHHSLVWRGKDVNSSELRLSVGIVLGQTDCLAKVWNRLCWVNAAWRLVVTWVSALSGLTWQRYARFRMSQGKSLGFFWTWITLNPSTGQLISLRALLGLCLRTPQWNFHLRICAFELALRLFRFCFREPFPSCYVLGFSRYNWKIKRKRKLPREGSENYKG